MKKIHVLFVCWFVFVLALSAAISSPLHYWKDVIQPRLSNGIVLQKIEGHLWRGSIDAAFPTLLNPVNIQWRLSLPLVNVQVTSDDFTGWGAMSFGFSGIDLWVDEARLGVDLLKPVAKSNDVNLDGSAFIVDRLFARLNYHSVVPEKWRGVGRFESINANYAFGNTRQNVRLNQVSVEWVTRDKAQLMLVYSHKGKHLLTVEPTSKEELEISIMPALLNEVGIPWSGDTEYPVAVLIEPLF
ncbi:hypothetical protein [Marinomonas sp. 2405UD68-3]|uniref:hypothetical protein n=1 Tax=Marinomonas sp. 2405UD68-3 TaxID=3391835 RepID=UPI0039C9481B